MTAPHATTLPGSREALDDRHLTPTVVQASRLGRYRVLETIGQGGMGLVYAAYDPVLDRRVAIKVLRPRAGQAIDPGHTARLAREAQAMARLAHPHVVSVYDVGSLDDERLFVAMEFVAGATLSLWLDEARPDWRRVLEVLLAAGRGLAAAHAAGLVHRDVKPGNVLVSDDGRVVKVTDFGLVAAGRTEVSDTRASPSFSLAEPLTLEGSVMGSPGYMAPEQYRGEPTSQATDQYSFCVTAYEALYGRRPFLGTTLLELTQQTSAGAVPPPPADSKVPAWLFPIIARGLHPQPGHRHASMETLLHALEQDPRRRRRRVWGLAAAVTLLAVLVAGLAARPGLRARACHDETARLSSVWSVDAQRAIEAAVRRAHPAGAETVWRFVRGSIDRAVSRFREERTQACRDTLERGVATEQQLELRLRCLGHRAVELDTLVSRLRDADAELVAEVPSALARLQTGDGCTSLTALEARAVLPVAQQAVATAIADRLADGRVLLTLGRANDARPKLEAALADARTLDDAQTLGLALLEVALLERDTDHYPRAVELASASLEAALRARDDRTALQAVSLLVSLVGWRLERPDEALRLLPVGRGLAPRVDDAVLTAQLERAESDARWFKGDKAGAKAALERALARVDATSLDAAQLLADLGWLSMEDDRLEEARAQYLEARRLREALLGEGHPQLASTWNDLGHLEELLGAPDAAERAYRRCWELRQQRSGPDALAAVRAEANVARALVRLGRLDEATPLVAHVAQALPADAPTAARVELLEVQAALLTGKGEPGAEAVARAAIDLRQETFGPDHPPGPTTTVLARALRQKGRLDEAIAFLQDAVAQHRRDGSVASPELIGTLLGLAEAYRDANDLTRALETAQQAIAAVEPSPNLLLRTRAQLELSSVWWASGRRAEAVDGVTHAQGVATANDAALRLTTAWLATHPP